MPDPDAPLDRRIATHLLAIGAVALSPGAPFTWASGRRAPIYCDNRLTLAYPSVRRAIATGFESVLESAGLRPDVVAGTATAGIPHAAWLADRIDLPMVYVRSSPKAHGKGRQIEGHAEAGQRAVVVEDLVSTGGSSLAAVKALREAGVEVQALVAIFSYGLPEAEAAFREAGVPLHTLTTFDVLLDVAVEEALLAPASVETLREWRLDPAAWSDRFVAAS